MEMRKTVYFIKGFIFQALETEMMTASPSAEYDALVSQNETGFGSLFTAKKKKHRRQRPSTVYVDGII